MAKPKEILLGDGTAIPILYEDRSVLAIDKPPGWMLAPVSWDRTGRNLQLALESSIQGRDHWAQSRQIKFLRFVHRLDAETSGVLLLARSPGALRALQALFETRRVQKTYLAVVQGVPEQSEWVCRLSLAPDPATKGKMKVVKVPEHRTKQRVPYQAKPAETSFRLLGTHDGISLVEARPLTGRTHQIRVHLAASGCPVLGDFLYGKRASENLPISKQWPLALRAIRLAYPEPFTGKAVKIDAPAEEFLKAYGFGRHGEG